MMRATTTFATIAAAAAAATLMFAAPQSANALPLAGAKQATKSNVENVGYYGRRHWRHRHGYYGHRRYYRRPGFGVYLGF